MKEHANTTYKLEANNGPTWFPLGHTLHHSNSWFTVRSDSVDRNGKVCIPFHPNECKASMCFKIKRSYNKIIMDIKKQNK